MSRFLGILGVLLVLGLSMGFAALNGGQRLTLRLGFVTIYRIPLSVVVFGSVILGMVIMMVAGIRSDLRVRRILRDRLAREDEEERARIYIDRNQKDLFEESPEVASPAAPPDASPLDPVRAPPDTGPEAGLDAAPEVPSSDSVPVEAPESARTVEEESRTTT